MGGPLSVTLADINMIRAENDVVKPMKPVFYKRYVDDIYSRSKKNCTDQLYHELNNYHSNINLLLKFILKSFMTPKLLQKMEK